VTVKILRPADWTTYSPTWFHGVVGTNPLGDEDDATYVYEDYSGFFGGSTSLPPLVGYESSDPIALHVRISTEWDGDPGTFQGVGEIHLGTTSSSDSEFASFGNDGASGGFGFYFTNENTTAELVLPLVLSPPWPSTSTLAGVVSALESGAWLLVNRLDWLDGSGNTTDPVMRLLEAWVEVGTPDGCYTVDLPAYGAIAPYGGTREDTLATPDTSTEIVIADVFQDIAVGTYGAPYDPGANVVLPEIPAGMTVTDARYVVIAYRESGSDITGDTSGGGYVPRGPTDQPFLFLDSGARSGQYLIDHLPIGGYGGELVSEFAESFASLQLDQPLNRLWLSYETSTAPPIHVAYLAIRLTICPVPSTVAPPCQIYPRDDGQGAGGGAIWPPPSSGRPGSYY
jgi:hypothetical protein